MLDPGFSVKVCRKPRNHENANLNTSVNRIHFAYIARLDIDPGQANEVFIATNIIHAMNNDEDITPDLNRSDSPVVHLHPL